MLSSWRGSGQKLFFFFFLHRPVDESVINFVDFYASQPAVSHGFCASLKISKTRKCLGRFIFIRKGFNPPRCTSRSNDLTQYNDCMPCMMLPIRIYYRHFERMKPVQYYQSNGGKQETSTDGFYVWNTHHWSSAANSGFEGKKRRKLLGLIYFSGL